MNNLLKTTLAALVLATVTVAPASANVNANDINTKIRSAISHGSVQVSVYDGVVTLFGWVENHRSERRAKQAALSFDGVDRVVDLITVSR